VDAYLLSRIRKKVIRFELSVPGKPPGENKAFMKKKNPNNGLRPEYDFAFMVGGVRAKHAKRYQEGTNIVLLDLDIAEAFPNDAAVNKALRGVLNTARAVRGTGGLAEKSLKTPGQRRTRRSKRA
jgi:hypothetical protein